MTIWRENYFTVFFLLVTYAFSMVLNVLLQEPKSRTTAYDSTHEYIHYLSSWKLIAADFYWFQFLQNDCSKLSAQQVDQAMDVIEKLDPHFTSAFRIGVMCLLRYHKQPSLAAALINRATRSEVNRADWRFYAYSLIANTSLGCDQVSQRIFTQLFNRPIARRLLAAEIPEMPNYLMRKLEA